MSKDRDLGLKTLLAVMAELNVDLDTGFLEKCFEIQKRYQFNSERTLSTQAMNRLIDSHVEKMESSPTKNRN